MHLVVSGASGLVGGELLELLSRRQHHVTQLVRRSPEANEARWDPEAETIDREAIAGADGFICLSGDNIASGRWTEAKKRRILDSRIKSTRLLAETAASLDPKPKVFVCASAIGFYGDRGEEELTEESAAGVGFLADVCQQWEAATQPAAGAGIRVVNLRIGVVLSKQGGALTKMLPVFKLGGGGVVGNGKQFWSWVGLHDLAAMLEFCATTDELRGPVNGVNGACTNREFTKALGRVLNRPTLFPLPGFVAKVMLGQMAEDLLLASTRVQPTKLQQAGFQFIDAGIEAALRAAVR